MTCPYAGIPGRSRGCQASSGIILCNGGGLLLRWLAAAVARVAAAGRQATLRRRDVVHAVPLDATVPVGQDLRQEGVRNGDGDHRHHDVKDDQQEHGEADAPEEKRRRAAVLSVPDGQLARHLSGPDETDHHVEVVRDNEDAKRDEHRPYQDPCPSQATEKHLELVMHHHDLGWALRQNPPMDQPIEGQDPQSDRLQDGENVHAEELQNGPRKPHQKLRANEIRGHSPEKVPSRKEGVRELGDTLHVPPRLLPPVEPTLHNPILAGHRGRLDGEEYWAHLHRRPQAIEEDGLLPGPRILELFTDRGVYAIEHAAEVAMVVLRHHIAVPWLSLHGKAQGDAVTAENHVVTSPLKAGDATELIHPGHVAPTARGCRGVPVVAEGDLGRLPHRVHVLGAGVRTHEVELLAREVLANGAEVGGVENAIRIRHREDYAVEVDEALFPALLPAVVYSPLQVRGLAWNLVVHGSVIVRLREALWV
mmetsp:Transcript_103543/g.221446  ORF Transcript_103543/g.221446 Transcript_103543/m.221446 type:complete len:478 (-) Transcript_103543:759-2192(-)